MPYCFSIKMLYSAWLVGRVPTISLYLPDVIRDSEISFKHQTLITLHIYLNTWNSPLKIRKGFSYSQNLCRSWRKSVSWRLIYLIYGLEPGNALKLDSKWKRDYPKRSYVPLLFYSQCMGRVAEMKREQFCF